MLTIHNLNLQFGNKKVFDNVSARIGKHDRIGLVGVNGAGKSTLLKLLAGVEKSDPGVITKSRECTVGYLPQEIGAFAVDTPLMEEAKSAFAPLLDAKEELDRVNDKLARIKEDDPEAPSLVSRQGELQHLLEQSGYFRMEAEIQKVLFGLGFGIDDLSRRVGEFSGGWQMRIHLAKILLACPALILLDEPTNHLDIESLTWLEGFLADSDAAMVIVSHDRAFLDNLTNTTWELSLGRLTAFRGNYSRYLVAKEERLKLQRAAYENQQAKIQQTMRFVERFRATSTKASQVQSRLKQLEKMERIELEEGEEQVRFRFPPAPLSGRVVLEVDGLGKSYGPQTVFENVDLLLERGEKLAVVGVNGAGKTTLVKILAGLIPPDRGSFRYGHNVQVSYFGQHQAQELHPDYTVFDTVYQVAESLNLTQVRSLLGAFLFRGDEVEKKVAVLSGGEKSRLALARMIATPANLLILDEPTNHLDISSQEVLKEAMRQFDGSVILVSHNRAFANSFVDKVLELKDGNATLFHGNIDHYLEKVRLERTADRREKDGTATPGDEPRRLSGKEARRLAAKRREEKQRRLSPLTAQLAAIEQKITSLEARKKELEAMLADPAFYRQQEQFAEASREYGELDRKLARAYDTWESIQNQILAIEERYAAAPAS